MSQLVTVSLIFSLGLSIGLTTAGCGSSSSSSPELGSDSGTITFTEVQNQAAVAGSFHATLGTHDDISGVFHATFCANGQGY